MAQDGQCGRVGKGGTQAEHDPVGEVQGADVLRAKRGQQQSSRGEDSAGERGQPQANLVRQTASHCGEEECGADGQGANQS